MQIVGKSFFLKSKKSYQHPESDENCFQKTKSYLNLVIFNNSFTIFRGKNEFLRNISFHRYEVCWMAGPVCGCL